MVAASGQAGGLPVWVGKLGTPVKLMALSHSLTWGESVGGTALAGGNSAALKAADAVAAAIKVMVMVERMDFIVIGVSVIVCRSIEGEEGYVW